MCSQLNIGHCAEKKIKRTIRGGVNLLVAILKCYSSGKLIDIEFMQCYEIIRHLFIHMLVHFNVYTNKLPIVGMQLDRILRFTDSILSQRNRLIVPFRVTIITIYSPNETENKSNEQFASQLLACLQIYKRSLENFIFKVHLNCRIAKLRTELAFRIVTTDLQIFVSIVKFNANESASICFTIYQLYICKSQL